MLSLGSPSTCHYEGTVLSPTQAEQKLFLRYRPPRCGCSQFTHAWAVTLAEVNDPQAIVKDLSQTF